MYRPSLAKDRVKCSLNSITNYVQLMCPYVFISRLMGFIPYKIVSSKFVYSKPYFVYSTIIFVSYVTYLAFCVYKVNFHYREIYTFILHRMHLTFNIIFGLVVITSAYALKRSVLRIIERISQISRMLPPKMFSSLAKKMYTKDALMFSLSLSFTLYGLSSYTIPLLYAVWIPFFVILVINTLYTNNVYVLEACLKEINDVLVKLREILLNDEPHLLRRVYHSQKNPILLAELRTLKKQHLEISEIVRTMDSAFGASILTILILLLIDISLNLYVYLVMMNQGGRITELFSINLFFVFHHVLEVILIIWATEKAKTQGKRIGSNIHRIIIHTYDKEITDELKLFSMQVLQKEITFTAKGLVLDATVLTKAVCSITTFLLVLIQFLVKPC
ncbi:putative gustatory receptor 28b isoform X2 [Ceratina calcarata]|uniref:Gustatory receptor n=1 Tax=Ceratina calcarata TaxID=156304 RepID=A0AAJ7S1J9_9HYME|nr:putative gustatory receptor 28b isoform X2 [Ceratina calcarata]